jgi:histidinol-phosphate aminotransferase
MKKFINRRSWFKSAFAVTSGVTLSAGYISKLMAAPVSDAELSADLPSSASGVKLNSNENPYGPSPLARQAILKTIEEGNRYPFDETEEMRQLIAQHEGVSPDHIHLGAGSGALLCQAGEAFGIDGGSMISAYPTFPLLMNYAETFNCKWDKINLNDKLEHDYAAMEAAIRPDTRLMFVCNPNNPTGTLVNPDFVHQYCERVSEIVTIYADEAYLEYLPVEQQLSMVDLVKKGKNIIVSRTFSKIYGLAGLRLGYIIAKPELINKIQRYSGDIPINQMALSAGRVCIGDNKFVQSTRDQNQIARTVLTDYLDGKGIFYGKSHTNFVFFESPAEGKTVLSKLKAEGYLIRIWNFKGKDWCRVSIGTTAQMQGFVKAFNKSFS